MDNIIRRGSVSLVSPMDRTVFPIPGEMEIETESEELQQQAEEAHNAMTQASS